MTNQRKKLVRMWVNQPEYSHPFAQYDREIVLADLEDVDEDGLVSVYFTRSDSCLFGRVHPSTLVDGWDVGKATSVKFQLSLTHAKAIIRELGRDGLERFLEAVNSQPEFLKHLGEFEDVSDLMTIVECGCSGSAHAAAFYGNAFKCLTHCHESIEDTLENACLVTPKGSEEGILWDVSTTIYKGFASEVCILAVETWVSHLSEFTEIFAKEGY